MKKYFLFLVLLIPNISFGIFENQNLEIITQNISVQIKSDQEAHISITETIKNTSNTIIDYTPFFPFVQKTTNPKYYVNLEGKDTKIITQNNEKADFVWKKSLETKNVSILQYFNNIQILQTSATPIKPNQSITSKLEYTASIEKNETWNAIEIPQTSGKNIQNIEISFQNLEKNIPHFFHTLPKGAQINKQENKFSYLFTGSNFTHEKPLQFIWDGTQNPTANWKNFSAQLAPLPTTKSFQKIFFLIDKSGSMSDNAWDIAEEATQSLLNDLSENITLNSGLFSDTLTLSQEKFTKNNSETQKTILDSIRNTSPVGKTDFESIFPEIPQNDLTILITDDENISIPYKKNDWIILHLQSDKINIETFLHQGISVIPIWRNHPQFIQKNEFIQKLNHIRPAVLAPTKFQNDHTYQPKYIRHFDDETTNISIQEKETSSPKNWKYHSFIQTLWAQYRLAEILEQYKNTRNAPLEAFFSVTQTFDIQSIFTDAESLKKAPVSEISQEIFRLQTEPQNSFEHKQTSHRQNQREDLNLYIKTFSEAHETLFKKFPEIFSTYSYSTESTICTPTRCIFTSPKNTQTKLRNIDKAFWNETESTHWGYEYLKEFIEDGIFTPNNAFEIKPNAPVTRAEFANAVYEYYSWRTPKNSQEKFSDIPDTHEYAKAIQFLRDQNIINGYADNTFRPNQTISRAESVKIILSIYRKTPTYEENPEIFVDTPGWEMGWTAKAFEEGIIQGEEQNGKRYFHPHRSISRVEMAKIIIE